MLPLSTAVWDPKWFHQSRGLTYRFLDKNNVMNGLRADPFVPNISCRGKCRGLKFCTTKNPLTCDFLKCYYSQLKNLPINLITQKLESLGERLRSINNFAGDPIFVFIVHEAVENPCSERRVIQRYFCENGIPCTEINPKEF